jgi:hypothetical protein
LEAFGRARLDAKPAAFALLDIDFDLTACLACHTSPRLLNTAGFYRLRPHKEISPILEGLFVILLRNPAELVYAGATPEVRNGLLFVLACLDREKLIRELHRSLSTVNC